MRSSKWLPYQILGGKTVKNVEIKKAKRLSGGGE